MLRAARRLRPTRLNGKAALHAPRHRPHAVRHPPAQVARPIDRAAHDGAGPSEHAAHGGGAAWGETIATELSTYHGGNGYPKNLDGGLGPCDLDAETCGYRHPAVAPSMIATRAAAE